MVQDHEYRAYSFTSLTRRFDPLLTPLWTPRRYKFSVELLGRRPRGPSFWALGFLFWFGRYAPVSPVSDPSLQPDRLSVPSDDTLRFTAASQTQRQAVAQEVGWSNPVPVGATALMRGTSKHRSRSHASTVRMFPKVTRGTCALGACKKHKLPSDSIS